MWTVRQITLARPIVAATALVTFTLLGVPVRTSSQLSASPQETIACRVLEVHTSQEPKIAVVVFYQRDEAERARLGALLREHDGESVQFQTPDGKWHPATLLRLKSCFGRGLLLFPAGAAQLGEKDEFTLQFSTNGKK